MKFGTDKQHNYNGKFPSQVLYELDEFKEGYLLTIIRVKIIKSSVVPTEKAEGFATDAWRFIAIGLHSEAMQSCMTESPQLHVLQQVYGVNRQYVELTANFLDFRFQNQWRFQVSE